MRQRRLRDVEASILSTPTGREWLWGVLNDLHVYEHRIPMSGSDREYDHYAGKREGGLGLMRRFMKASPDMCAVMHGEWDI